MDAGHLGQRAVAVAFAKVVEGMNVVDSLYSGYGEGAPDGQGPDQMRAMSEGNAYLQRDFPKLDYIVKATVLTPAAASGRQ